MATKGVVGLDTPEGGGRRALVGREDEMGELSASLDEYSSPAGACLDVRARKMNDQMKLAAVQGSRKRHGVYEQGETASTSMPSYPA